MPQLTILSNIPSVRTVIAKLPPALFQTGLVRSRNAAQEFTKRMQKPGKGITYPVNWDSLEQQRAFFASNGFGGGIPTVRKNRYINAWQVRNIPLGAESFNKSGVTRYISGLFDGKGQSNIHKNRWDKMRDNMLIVVRKLERLLIKDVRETINRTVGKL
jgi:hypothetical protein